MNGCRDRPVPGWKYFSAVLGQAKLGPNKAWAAVAPRQTTIRGPTAEISASSHGRQAAISREFGFLWSRILPRGSHLKCFTAFVT